MISRRGLIGGLGALIAAPAIVRAANIMPVRGIKGLETIKSITVVSAGSGYTSPPLAFFDLEASMRRYAELCGFPVELVRYA